MSIIKLPSPCLMIVAPLTPERTPRPTSLPGLELAVALAGVLMVNVRVPVPLNVVVANRPYALVPPTLSSELGDIVRAFMLMTLASRRFSVELPDTSTFVVGMLTVDWRANSRLVGIALAV